MFKPLGSYLNKAVSRTGVAKTVKAAVIVEQASHLFIQVLPQLRPGDFKVISFRAGTLTIAAMSPSLAHDIRLHREPLLEVLQDAFPDAGIKRFRFVPMPFEPEY